MFIPQTFKKFDNFYMDDSKDIEEYIKLINDPSINILHRESYTQKETTFEGESQTVSERPCMKVEYEICSI